MNQPLHDVPLEHVLALGDHTQTGQYRVDLVTEQWWWSDETYRIHGFEPAEVDPTTAMILAHKHPDDRERVRHVLEVAWRTGEPFATAHRIVDANGHDHVVSIVGKGQRDDSGEVVELVGYFLDLTRSVSRLAATEADTAIRAAARSRRDIEQAKAAVGQVLGVDDEEALKVLRHHSNNSNVPLRDLSRWLVAHSRTAPRAVASSPSYLLDLLRHPRPAVTGV